MIRELSGIFPAPTALRRISLLFPLLLAAAMFLKGIANLLAQTVILVLWAGTCITASCRYYKTEKSI